jgi:hypothetical protein
MGNLPAAIMRVVKTTIQKSFYRNGQLREAVPLRKGRRHGVARTWHNNGQLMSEEPYQNGVLHGVCRQWSESGRLLGKYRMIDGTGVQRLWHDNGQRHLELSTVNGDLSGCYRLWLQDGTLLSKEIYLHGRIVTAKKYRAARAKDPSLSKLIGGPTKSWPKGGAEEKRMNEVFFRFLLQRPNRSEARKWLGTGGKKKRSLGRFKSEGAALKWVEEFYRAGASEVIAPDVYSNKAGDQFADCLLVRMPRIAARRKAIRKVAALMAKRKLGAFQPEKDRGESHLYLLMSCP